MATLLVCVLRTVVCLVWCFSKGRVHGDHREGLWKPRWLSLIPEILRPMEQRFGISNKLQGCCWPLNNTRRNRLLQETTQSPSHSTQGPLTSIRPSPASFFPYLHFSYLRLQSKELFLFPTSSLSFLASTTFLCQTPRSGTNRCLAGSSLPSLHALEVSILTRKCLFALLNFYCSLEAVGSHICV